MSSIKPLFLNHAVDAISYFDDDEPAIPVASKISTGTEGISTCIAVFIRIKTENNDCLMGSIHLKSGYDLENKVSIFTSIADLYTGAYSTYLLFDIQMYFHSYRYQEIVLVLQQGH